MIFDRRGRQSVIKTRETRRRKLAQLMSRKPRVESLEQRRLLAVDLSGPIWVAQGPSPIINGQVENIPSTGSGLNAVVGAVHDVAAHPSDANTLYIGTTNGGVWKTSNATNANPTWTPLTDQLPDSAIGALEFDPTDASNNTLVAGFGNFSSFFSAQGSGNRGGPTAGLIRTTDGGATWTQLGVTELTGRNISGLATRGNVLLVGANTFSGGLNPGVYRSGDNGASFQFISGVAPGLATGEVLDVVGDPNNLNRVYVSVAGVGVFRTDDLGANWTNITAGDPAFTAAVTAGGNNNLEMAVAPPSSGPLAGRLYATVVDNGKPNYIGFSDNPGAATPAWTQMDLPVTLEQPLTVTGASNTSPITMTSPFHGLRNGDIVRIAGVTGNTAANGDFQIQNVTNNTFQLFTLAGAAVAGNGIYGGGGTIRELSSLTPREKPGSQGGIHFSITVDPNVATTFYIGGDRQEGPNLQRGPGFSNSLGATDFSGRLFRGDTTVPAVAPGAVNNAFSPQWEHLTHTQNQGFANGGTASNSSPHADSRDMAFDASGRLIEVDDGGIYVRTNPQNNTGDWFPLMGSSLQNTEMHNVAYDSLSKIIISGNQDTGTSQQTSSGSKVWTEVPLSGTFGQGFLFSTADGGDVAVDQRAAGSTLISTTQSTRYSSIQGFRTARRIVYDAQGNVVGAPTPLTLTPNDGINLQGQFVTPIAVNESVGGRLLIGAANGVFESFDQGATTTRISTAVANRTHGSAIAYGAPGFPNVAYVGAGTQVGGRTVPGALVATAALPAASVDFVNDVVINPTNVNNVCAVDHNEVFCSTDGGFTSWQNFTFNLPDPQLYSLEFIPNPTTNLLIVGGSTGVFSLKLDGSNQWTRFGKALPTAPAWDLDYSSVDDVLVVGTMGRGAFLLPDASTSETAPVVLDVKGDMDNPNQDDNIVIIRNANNPMLVDVTVNGSLFGPYDLASIDRINVQGLGGNDTLTVDSTNGLITVPEGIRFDGDAGFDRLDLRQTDGPTQTSETVHVGQTPGDGRDVIVGPGGTQTVQFENLEPVTTNVPAANFNITAVAGLASLLQDDNQINYESSSLFGPAWGRVTVDNFEFIDFTNKDNLTIDAGAGSDEINLNHPANPTGATPGGLKNINVNGDDSVGSDHLIVQYRNLGSTIDYTSARRNSVIAPQTVVITGAQFPTVNAGTVESIHIEGAGGNIPMTVNATANPDIITVTPGSTLDAGSIRIAELPTGISEHVPLTYANFGEFGFVTINGAGGADTLVYHGTSADDTFVVAAGTGTVDVTSNLGNHVDIRQQSVENLTLIGHDGDDQFTVAANHPFNGAAGVEIEGGNPSASDTLLFTGFGAGLISIDYQDRTVTQAGGAGPTSFAGIEHLNVDANGAPVTLLGETTGPNHDETFHIRPRAGVTSPVKFERDGDNTQITVEDVGGAALTLDPRVGIDTVNYEGLDNGDVSTVTYAATTTISNLGNQTVGINGTFTSVLNINTNGGNDAVTLIGSATFIGTDPQQTNVHVGAGDDTVTATGVTNGGIHILGGDGNDTLIGGAGIDRIEGESGNDEITGGASNDFLFGGADSDLIIWNNGDGSDLMEGGVGVDRVQVNGADGTAASEDFTVEANGGRVELRRNNLTPFTLDIAQVEELDLNTGDSSDDAEVVTVNSLVETELQLLNINVGTDNNNSIILNGNDSSETITIGPNEQILGLGPVINTSPTLGSFGDELTINANGGNDSIIVAAPVNVDLVLDGGLGEDLIDASLQTTLVNMTIRGGAGNDMLIGSAVDDTINGDDGDDTIDGRGGTNTIDGGTGANTFLIRGTEGIDALSVTHTAGTLAVTGGLSAGTNNFTNVQRVLVEAGEGSDLIGLNTLAGGLLTYDVRGGDPIGTEGDVLNLTSQTGVTFMAGPENDSGSLLDADGAIISWDEIEDVLVAMTPPGPVIVMGTGGDDEITVEGGEPGMVNVTVNDGPTISYAGVSTLTLQGKEGDDDFTVDTNITDLGVVINVEGGLPTAGSDELRVTGVDGVDDLANWTPTGVDMGALTFAGVPAINVTGIEYLFYDGEGDQETLTVTGDGVGAGNDEQFIHTPGASVDSGTIDVANLTGGGQLLGIHYENLGNAGTANVDGRGQTFGDTLFALGSAGQETIFLSFPTPDSILLNLANEAGPHNRLTSTSVENYTISMGEGNDLLTAQAPISVSGFFVIDGGGPGLGTDVVQFLGATGATENVVVSTGTQTDDQSVTGLSPNPIPILGVERLNFSGQAGDLDSLTVNLGTGDNTATVQRGQFGLSGNDLVTSDSLPPIEFGGFDRFAVDASGQGSDVVTFKTWFLQGAVPANYQFNGGGVDTLIIEGSDGAGGGDDSFTVTNPTVGSVAVTDNNGAGVTVTASNAMQGRVEINTLGGNDIVQVDNSGGLIAPLIAFHGDSGNDVLQLTGTTAIGNATYQPGPAVDAGSILHDTMQIEFSGLEPVLDNVNANDLAIIGTNGPNSINYTAGTTGGPFFTGPSGLVSVDGFETYEFNNKTSLTLRGNGGDDQFNIDHTLFAAVPTGLTAINVDGGAPGNSDSVQITGTPGADTFAYTATGENSATITQAGVLAIAYLLTDTESVFLDGEPASDTLNVMTPNATVTPDAIPGSGVVDPVSAVGAELLSVSYEEMESVVVTGGVGVIQGTQENDVIDISSTGIVTVTNELGFNNVVDMSAFANIMVNALGGDDRITVAGNAPFATIGVLGGDNGTATDVLNFVATADVAVDLAARTITDGGPVVAFDGVEDVATDANGFAIDVAGTAADDAVSIRPDNGTVQLTLVGLNTVFDFSDMDNDAGDFEYTAAGGNDEVTVNSDSNGRPHNIALGATTVVAIQTPAYQPVDLTGINHLNVNGGAGSDTFNVSGVGPTLLVDGGDPIGTVGDVLILQANTSIVSMAGPEPDSGGFLIDGAQLVSYDHIELINVNDPTPADLAVTVMGTGADDDITAEGITVNGVNVTVNDGPTTSYVGVSVITLQGKQGDDDITVDVNVPTINVTFNVEGGLPTAGSDELRITGVDGTDDAPIWTPSDVDAGLMMLAGQMPINVSAVETIIYDGESDDESLTVAASGAANEYFFGHRPGLAIDAGFMGIRNTNTERLGIHYENLGSAGNIVADGSAVTSARLTAFGTPDDDIVEVLFPNPNEIDLDLTSGYGAHIDLLSRVVQNYEIQSLGGNDAIQISGSVQATGLSVRAGGPGGSDVLTFADNAGADDNYAIALGNQSGDGMVSVNGIAVDYIGVEHIELFGSADAGDLLNVNDELSDNTWTVNAGPIGDRVQVDGRESIDFTRLNDVALNNQFGSDIFNVHLAQLTGFAGELTVNSDGDDDVFHAFGTEDIDLFTSDADTITLGGVNVTVGDTGFAEVRVSSLGGNDSIDLDLALAGVRKVIDAGAEDDNVNASGMLDATIFGGLGNDTIIGSPLADTIFGGAGNDILIGGGGNDTQYGEDGDDIFGNPTLIADGVPDDPGVDMNFGGAGVDNFIWEPGDGPDINRGGDDGADVFRFFGNGGGSTFDLQSGPTPTQFDALFSGVTIANTGIEDVIVDPLGGDDTINVNDLFLTEVVNVRINAGGGDETINVAGRTIADDLQITAGGALVEIEGLAYDVRITDSTVADDLIVNVREGNDKVHVAEGVQDIITTEINGGGGDDHLSGWFNTANGEGGSDTLLGASISQAIDGGDDDDTVSGNGGTDTVSGSGGADTILTTGSADNDVFELALNTSGHLLATAGAVTTVYVATGNAPFAGAGFERLLVEGNAGDDTLHVNVDAGSGSDVIGTSITFRGGDGEDLVSASGAPTTPIDNVTYTPGAAPEEGRVNYANAAGTALMTIDFYDLEPFVDTVLAGFLFVDGDNAANAISYTVGPNSGIVNAMNPAGDTTGMVAIDLAETYEFANKGSLTIRAMGGSDEFSIHNATTPTLLTGITLVGGDPTAGSDVAIISATAAPNAIDFAPTADDEATVTITGQVPVNLVTVERAVIDGQGGNDTLTYTSPDGRDNLIVTPGITPDAGQINGHRLGGPAESLMPLSFVGLDAGGELMLADVNAVRTDTVEIRGTNEVDDIDVTATGLVLITDTIGNRHLVNVTAPGVDVLMLQGLNGDDTFNIAGNHPFPGNVNQFGIYVEGGNPDTGSDELNFLGSGTGAVVANLETVSITESGFAPVGLIGIETANVDSAAEDLTVITTVGNDQTRVVPTGPSEGTLVNNDTSPVVHFTGVDTFRVNQNDGDDTLRVDYTTNADVIEVNVPAGSISDGLNETIEFFIPTTESIQVFGGDDDDTFDVFSDPNIPIFIDGGDPIGNTAGDTLMINGPAIFEQGPQDDEGRFVNPGAEAISFDHIEAAVVDGGPPFPAKAFIAGNGDDNDITIIARDASTHAGADGVRDFTSTVDSGLEVLWLNFDQLVIDARSGDDDIVFRVPAPNDADWDVDAWVFGGAPAAGPGDDGDRLVVETPQATADAILYTPTGVDSGTLVIDEDDDGSFGGTDTVIQIGSVPVMPVMPGFPVPDPGGIELLVYDSGGGDDRIEVLGDGTPGDDDQFKHVPGQVGDQGFVGATGFGDTLLGIHYENLGFNGFVTVNGLTGTNSLTVLGSLDSDLIAVDFSATNASVIRLFTSNGRHTSVLTENVQNYVLETLDGDDDIDLVPSIAADSFRVRGGSPGSGSDTLVIDASSDAADNDVVIRPNAIFPDDQIISGLGADIDVVGIETIHLIGDQPQDDSLTIQLGSGDNAARVQRSSTQVGLEGDLVTSDSLPDIGFAGMDDFLIDGQAGSDVVTFATWNLIGATNTNYSFDGTAIDTLVIEGSDGSLAGDDDFVIGNPAAGPVAVTDVNGTNVTVTATNALLGRLQINSLGGDDDVVVNVESPGSDVIGVPITFNGGGGSDLLTVRGNPATAIDEVVYTPGQAVTDGRLVYEDAADAALMTIDFTELEPVVDLVVAANLTVNGTNGANSISYGQGAVAATGLVAVDGFEAIEFSNKAQLNLNGNGGSDEFSLNNPSTPTSLARITVNGGDPTAGSDTVILSATTGADAINFAVTTDDDAVVVGAGPVPITLATIENAVIDGQGGNDGLTYTSPAAADSLIYTPGTDFSAGTITGVQVAAPNSPLMPLSFTNIGNGSVTFADLGAARIDDLFVQGTTNDDVFGVSATGVVQIQKTNNQFATLPINTPGVDQIILQGFDGSDTFNVVGNHPFTDNVNAPITIEGGNPDNGSDVLNFNGAGAAITADLAARTITEAGFGAVAISGVETVNIAAAAAPLAANLTSDDDELTYRPTGAAAGTFQNENDNTTFHFSGATNTFTVNALASVGDHVIVEGTNSHDQILVDSPNRTVTVTDAAGIALKTVTLANDVELITAQARSGNDTVLVVPSPTVGAVTGGNLQVNVDGGGPGASDALVVATAAGATLQAADFVVNAVGLNPGEGRVRVYRNAVAMPDISYVHTEIVSPNVVVAGGVPQLLILGPDASEPNEFRTNATHLGAGETINVDNLAIFPNFGEHPNVPADVDFFQIVAETTGTLDVTAFFETYATNLLPAGGQLGVNVLDSAGNLIVGAGAFGNPDATPNARVRFPAVQGQTYFVTVFGANANGTANNAVVNGYELTIVNEAPPVPYDLELNDILQVGTVNNAIVPTLTDFRAAIAPANPVLPPANFDYVGKTVEFTSGVNVGRSAVIANFNNATGQFTVGTGLIAPPAATDTFLIETTDTGRSQFDNVTRDNMPIVTFRLDDDILLLDVPGDFVTGNPADEVIPIPFNPAQNAGPAAAAVGNAGFRVPVFIEGAPQQPGTAPQTPIGYARPLAGTPGVYIFDFGIDAIPGATGLALTDGSHFISAKVEIIDPSIDAFFNDTGFGQRSDSLEIIVDTGAPPVSFGDPLIATDGLHPDSDSGDPFVPSTLSDRATNDTTPTFFGRAEANSIVRAYVDRTNNGFSVDDILIGQTVATPLDGTNQHPFGEWEITSTVNMNDPVLTAALGLDGVRNIFISAEDEAGVTSNAALTTLQIFIDTQGPQVTNVFITSAPNFNLFSVKPLSGVPQGPTPPVNSLTINVRDLPARAAGFLYAAISNLAIAPTAGFLPPVALVGDHSGVISIVSANFTSDGNLANNGPPPIIDPLLAGNPATGFITLTFAQPLPDDRFTLTLKDSIIDPVGNALDGENNAAEPNGNPTFPTGDSIPGGDFIARFTVDSRPEVATWAQGSVYADINGNLVWDPEGEDNDATNRDFAYKFGLASDGYFTGNFSNNPAAASGFDKLGVYGSVNGVYQFFLDTNDDGVGDLVPSMAFGVNAIPVAGNFDNVAAPAGQRPRDEIGAFDGQNWYLDVNGNNQIDGNERFPTSMRGLPVVGDFNGDGFDDLATYNNNTGVFQFDLNRDGTADDTVLTFGFPGFGDRPVTGDFNLDGIDDVVLWVPGQEGQLPKESGEFHFLLSDTPAALPSNVFAPFSPAPLGNDLIAQFGDDFALPLIGNFDPPIAADGQEQPGGSLSNELNPLDTTVDGQVTARDALVVINALGKADFNQVASPLRVVASLGGYKLDASQDGAITALDALRVINGMAEIDVADAELVDRADATWAAATDSVIADLDDDEDDLMELLAADREYQREK